jgi:hypothetical protein
VPQNLNRHTERISMTKSKLDSWSLKYTPRTRGAKTKAASRPEHFTAGTTEHELALREPTDKEIKDLSS